MTGPLCVGCDRPISVCGHVVSTEARPLPVDPPSHAEAALRELAAAVYAQEIVDPAVATALIRAVGALRVRS